MSQVNKIETMATNLVEQILDGEIGQAAADYALAIVKDEFPDVEFPIDSEKHGDVAEAWFQAEQASYLSLVVIKALAKLQPQIG